MYGVDYIMYNAWVKEMLEKIWIKDPLFSEKFSYHNQDDKCTSL